MGRKTATTKPVVREPTPRVLSRISRLMALAIRFDGLIHSGEVADQAALCGSG